MRGIRSPQPLARVRRRRVDQGDSRWWAMTRRNVALAGATLALVGVFALVAISVVDARRPLDAKVSRSFDAAAPKLGYSEGTVDPKGCHKVNVNFYDCVAVVRQSRREGEGALRYRLALTEDGCWIAVRIVSGRLLEDLELQAPLARLTGCFEDATRGG